MGGGAEPKGSLGWRASGEGLAQLCLLAGFAADVIAGGTADGDQRLHRGCSLEG